MSTELFYTELGKLLYAVAIADDKITKSEKESITKMISERMLQKEKETDGFNTNEAWYTKFSFDTAEESGLSEEEALNNFLDFVKIYKKELTESELSLCLKLADTLAETYHHINKKENTVLAELRSHLISLQASQLIF